MVVDLVVLTTDLYLHQLMADQQHKKVAAEVVVAPQVQMLMEMLEKMELLAPEVVVEEQVITEDWNILEMVVPVLL